MDEPVEANRALWDAWTRINLASSLYDVEGFAAGGTSNPSRSRGRETCGASRCSICSATSGWTPFSGRGTAPR